MGRNLPGPIRAPDIKNMKNKLDRVDLGTARGSVTYAAASSFHTRCRTTERAARRRPDVVEPIGALINLRPPPGPMLCSEVQTQMHECPFCSVPVTQLEMDSHILVCKVAILGAKTIETIERNYLSRIVTCRHTASPPVTARMTKEGGGCQANGSKCPAETKAPAGLGIFLKWSMFLKWNMNRTRTEHEKTIEKDRRGTATAASGRSELEVPAELRVHSVHSACAACASMLCTWKEFSKSVMAYVSRPYLANWELSRSGGLNCCTSVHFLT